MSGVLLAVIVFGVPLVVGIMAPRRYRLFAALVAAAIAAWLWRGGLSIHGEPSTLLFMLLVPFSVGALTRAGIDRIPPVGRRIVALPAIVLMVWAFWFSPTTPSNEPALGPTFLLNLLAALTGAGVLVNLIRVELLKPIWSKSVAMRASHGR